MKFRTNQDYFNTLCEIATIRFRLLPEHLDWIEPSINMLYLNAVISYIFDNNFASIICTGILLEHVLRLAIIDRKNSGLKREISQKKFNSLGSITEVIKKAKEEKLIDEIDFNWWDNVAKTLRNKSAHFLIPKILNDFTRKDYNDIEKDRERYHPKDYKFTDEDGNPHDIILHDWGSFFHKSDAFIAKAFLLDSTKQIKKIILKTNWEPDRSWWISQENWYNSFFKFDWHIENMIQSLQNMYISL